MTTTAAGEGEERRRGAAVFMCAACSDRRRTTNQKTLGQGEPSSKLAPKIRRAALVTAKQEMGRLREKLKGQAGGGWAGERVVHMPALFFFLSWAAHNADQF